VLKTLFKSPTALFYAIVVHAALIAVLVFSMDWSSLKENKPKVNIVDAVAVDESKILKQIEDLKKKERQKKKKEDRRQKKLKDSASKAKKARKKEEEELAKLIKKRR
jgi:colicin import membrane protein